LSPEPVAIHFSPGSLTVLNVCLAVIMFGVALDIRWNHFAQLVYQKKAVVTGLFSQFILLPLLTVALVSVLPISNGMALGMLLVASCPGGNVSNFFTQLARGHLALSVTLTAFSSLCAFLVTPLIFFLTASWVPSLSVQLKAMEIDFLSLMLNMILILLVPLIAGMWVAERYSSFSKRISPTIRVLSIMMLAGFIGVAVFNNREGFVAYLADVFWIVLFHNGLALIAAYYLSKSLKNQDNVNRTIAIETGIQNSGLALILIFNFFDGNTAMAVVAAWWGVWHLISGFFFASLVRSRSLAAVQS
jgi:BASS family bile acid:Na+ symporter